MDFQKICEDVVTETEGALGCLAIDLHTGLILASGHPPDAAMNEAEIESALRYTIEMFRGRFIERFMRSMLIDRTSVTGFVREAQVTTERSHLFMAVVPGLENGAVVLATEKTLTLGLAWMAVHQAQETHGGIQARGARAPRPGATPDADSGQPAPGEMNDGERAPDAAAPGVPPSESPSHEVAASDQSSAASPTGHLGTTPADPKPIPPPKEELPSDPIPNPLMANKRRAERLKAAASTPRPSESRESDEPDESGKRTGMFRRRSRKKDRK